MKTNYHGQLMEEQFPFPGIAVERNVNFKTSQTLLFPSHRTRQMLLSRIALISAAISAVSNGANVVVAERDYRQKTAAALTTAMSGSNNDVTLTAVTKGTGGNSITLTLVDPSANDAALAVSVDGSDISVSLATGGAGAITTTASQLVAALAGNAGAAALVTAAVKSGDTGASAVTALAETPLTGGLEWVVVQAAVVSSVDLADSDSVGKTQALTIAAGTAPIQPGNDIAVTITAGTATVDTKDIVIEGAILP